MHLHLGNKKDCFCRKELVEAYEKCHAKLKEINRTTIKTGPGEYMIYIDKKIKQEEALNKVINDFISKLRKLLYVAKYH